MTVALREYLSDYLAMRRSLGYRLVRAEKLLGQFCDFIDVRGEQTITTRSALDWAQLPDGGLSWWAYRLNVVRGFARYLHGIDPAHEVPAAELVPDPGHRAVPYLYSDDEINALIDATESLSTPLRRATFATLIGLLTVTGIRVGEAIGLDFDDVDLSAGHLTIRAGKFGKSRELVLHPSTVIALEKYQCERRRLAPHTPTRAFFVSLSGTRLLYCNVHTTWQRLRDRAGLRARTPACRPRIHDLRHSFAVNSMLDAYAAGEDGQTRLTLLSTWLGHVDPASTYWYLSASPDLMAAAGKRLDAYLDNRDGDRR